MDDDGDMAEMYLTEKKQRYEGYSSSEQIAHPEISGGLISDELRSISKSAPISPVGEASASRKLQRAFSSIVTSGKHGSLLSTSSVGENIDQLEMLLEAYFVVIDNTLSKLSSVRITFFS